MFGPITIPQNAVMLFNEVVLKPGVTVDDVEEALAEMCNVVKENYTAFVAGQVFEFAGFISDEGSINKESEADSFYVGNKIAIVTYWTSFDEHEKSHADALFRSKFSKLLEFSKRSVEYGYKNLWQGQR